MKMKPAVREEKQIARAFDVSAQEEVGPNFALAHKAVVLLDAEN